MSGFEYIYVLAQRIENWSKNRSKDNVLHFTKHVFISNLLPSDENDLVSIK